MTEQADRVARGAQLRIPQPIFRSTSRVGIRLWGFARRIRVSNMTRLRPNQLWRIKLTIEQQQSFTQLLPFLCHLCTDDICYAMSDLTCMQQEQT